MLTTEEKEEEKINRNSTMTYHLSLVSWKKKKTTITTATKTQTKSSMKQASIVISKDIRKKTNVPSPSLSKRLKASLNSAIWSSVNCSTMLSGLESLSSVSLLLRHAVDHNSPARARTRHKTERKSEKRVSGAKESFTRF